MNGTYLKLDSILNKLTPNDNDDKQFLAIVSSQGKIEIYDHTNGDRIFEPEVFNVGKYQTK